MITIIELHRDLEDGFIEEATKFIWSQWGTKENYSFYRNCIFNSLSSDIDLPKFYIATHEDEIIGCYAILRNDLISRQDLFPWFACLYVIPEFRGQAIGKVLLEHATEKVRDKGYNKIYLCTTHDNYYEKYGWKFVDKGYYFNGEETKIYVYEN